MARYTLRSSVLETVSSFLHAWVIVFGVAELTVGVKRCKDGPRKNKGLFSIQLKAKCQFTTFISLSFECLSTKNDNRET